MARLGGVLLACSRCPLLWFARAEYFGNGLEAFFRLLWLFWWLALVQAAGIKLVAPCIVASGLGRRAAF